MITRKGVGRVAETVSLRLVTPYITMVLLPLAACWCYLARYGSGSAEGYLFFALQDAVVFLLVLAVVLIRETAALSTVDTPRSVRLRRNVKPVTTVGILTTATIATAIASWQPIWDAISST
jgi:cellulose synthase (UDP-forming)